VLWRTATRVSLRSRPPEAKSLYRKQILARAPGLLHPRVMQTYIVPVALIALSIIGVALVAVAYGIYRRLASLTRTLDELRALAAGSQGELVLTKEGIGRVQTDLDRLVSNANVASQVARSMAGLPTR
jgi:hypothetical protein